MEVDLVQDYDVLIHTAALVHNNSPQSKAI